MSSAHSGTSRGRWLHDEEARRADEGGNVLISEDVIVIKPAWRSATAVEVRYEVDARVVREVRSVDGVTATFVRDSALK